MNYLRLFQMMEVGFVLAILLLSLPCQAENAGSQLPERAALVATYEQARQSVETYPQAIYALHELMHIDLNHQSPPPEVEPPKSELQDSSPKTQAPSKANSQPETPNSQPETGNWKPETHPDAIRLSYLAKLRPLYAGLVTDRPSQLRYGVGLADVLNESAMLRREQLLRTLRDGQGDPLTMFREAEAVLAEGREAAKVLGDTLTRGRGDQQRAAKVRIARTMIFRRAGLCGNNPVINAIV